jgi:serine/threonine protein phosphatase 1
MIKKFDKNENGRDFVVGDIHGCFSILHEKLLDIKFDNTVDRLFSVGDLVDRGPESIEVLEWLKQPWFHAVKGNHEEMTIMVSHGGYDLSNYIYNGGSWFIDLPIVTSDLYVNEFVKLPYIIQIDTDNGPVVIVHAQFPGKSLFDIKFDDRSLDVCLWSRDLCYGHGDGIVEGVYRVYVGHTPAKEPFVVGNHHFIDTGCFHTGVLTVAQIND